MQHMTTGLYNIIRSIRSLYVKVDVILQQITTQVLKNITNIFQTYTY